MSDARGSEPHLGDLISLEVEHAPDQFLGCPWWAAWVVRSTDPEVTFYSLVLPDERGTHGALGVQLEAPGLSHLDHPPALPSGLHTVEPGFDLEGGEVRRGLVDVASFMPTGLSPGMYEVRLSYIGKPHFRPARSVPTTLRLLSPPTEVWSYVSALRPMRDAEGSWLAVCGRLVQRGVAPPLPPSHPLAWPMLLARSTVDPVAFARLPGATFQGWSAPLRPHVRLLFIQWLVANGQVAQARVEAGALRRDNAGLSHALAE
ncbi:MAG: hypothetical protein U0271_20235 [Polyangiaceae bacterium]